MTTNLPQVFALDDLKQMANAIAQSGLFGVKQPLEALSLMLIAQAEGLHPATIAQDYDIIQGRPTRKTHSVLSRFQQAGGKVKWLELTDTCAKAEFFHPAGGTVIMDWDLARAKRTMVWNGKKNAWEALAERQMYSNYPRAMLRARVIAEGVRAVYPAAIGGMLVPEEAHDALPDPDEIDMGNAVVVDQPKPKNKPKAAAPESTNAAPQASKPSDPGRSAGEPEKLAATTPAEAVAQSPSEPAPAGPAPKSEQHTLAECTAILDETFKAGHVQEGMAKIEPWKKDLSPSDQAALKSLTESLLAEQEGANEKPPKKLMIDGQKRILRARLNSNNKTIEQLEKEFGKLDTLAFEDFEKVQAWIIGEAA